jgi:hypothetical protein
VSIKNKLVTAVTTAGLLAGLFGSAFVPSANAGRVTGEVLPKASLTVVTEGAGFREVATLKTFAFQSADSSLSGDGVPGLTTTLAFEINSVGGVAAPSGTRDIKAVSSSSSIKVAWAQNDACSDDDAEDDESVFVPENVFGTTDLFEDAEQDTVAGGVVAGTFTLCVAASKATTAAAGTITVSFTGSAGTFVAVKTVNVVAVGPVASLNASITDGFKYIAGDNEPLVGWISVEAKDARGVVINGAGDGALSIEDDPVLTDLDEDLQPEDANGDPIAFLGDGEDDGTYSVLADVCLVGDEDADINSDAGKSYSVKFTDGDVVSNAITYTCTMGGDTARVGVLKPEATTGPADYALSADGKADLAAGGSAAAKGADGVAGTDDDDGELSLDVTITDEDGRPLGDGAGDVSTAFGWDADITQTDTAPTSSLAYTASAETDAVGGVLRIGHLLPDVDRTGKISYSITAANSTSEADAADEVEKKLSSSYTVGVEFDVTVTVKYALKKKRATITADGGETLSNELVQFEVESANGKLTTFTRRANSDGVATLVMNRRNTTVYVSTYIDDGEDFVLAAGPDAVTFK